MGDVTYVGDGSSPAIPVEHSGSRPPSTLMALQQHLATVRAPRGLGQSCQAPSAMRADPGTRGSHHRLRGRSRHVHGRLGSHRFISGTHLPCPETVTANPPHKQMRKVRVLSLSQQQMAASLLPANTNRSEMRPPARRAELLRYGGRGNATEAEGQRGSSPSATAVGSSHGSTTTERAMHYHGRTADAAAQNVHRLRE